MFPLSPLLVSSPCLLPFSPPPLSPIHFFSFSFSFAFHYAFTVSVGDVYANVLAKHGKEFMRLSENHPSFLLGLASDFGLNLLKTAHDVYVDGTFNITEVKLVLTVLLVVLEKVAIPCAFLLANTRERWAYEKFFEVCV